MDFASNVSQISSKKFEITAAIVGMLICTASTYFTSTVLLELLFNRQFAWLWGILCAALRVIAVQRRSSLQDIYGIYDESLTDAVKPSIWTDQYDYEPELSTIAKAKLSLLTSLCSPGSLSPLMMLDRCYAYSTHALTLNVISSILFLGNRGFLLSLPWVVRVGFFGVLGPSLTLVLLTCILDLADSWHSSHPPPTVKLANAQQNVLYMATCLVGVIQGFYCGALDLDSGTGLVEFYKHRIYFVPVSCLVGGATGILMARYYLSAVSYQKIDL